MKNKDGFYHAVKFRDNIYINHGEPEGDILAYQADIFYILLMPISDAKDTYIIKEYDHSLTIDYIRSKGSIYISDDRKAWWEWKNDDVFLFDTNIVNLSIIKHQISSKWDVWVNGDIIEPNITVFQNAIYVGKNVYDIYCETKRQDIIDRMDKMLKSVTGKSQSKINTINKNFVARKTGGLTKNEIILLNEINGKIAIL